MQSGVLQLAPGIPASGDDLGRRVRALSTLDRAPDAVCAFLPAGADLEQRLEALAAAVPDAVLFGCEAATQFAGPRTHSDGTLHLYWFEHPDSGLEVIPLEAGAAGLTPEVVERAIQALGDTVHALLLADGLRFPTQEMVRRLGDRLGERTVLAGGLASQPEPIDGPGARVFCGTEVLDAGCLLVVPRGLRMDVRVVRGWEPASPIYTVTAAEGNELAAIDGEPAADWLRRFFTVDGRLAPMPGATFPFPFILEGPDPARRGLYRTVRAFDEPPGRVTLWGDVQPGDRLRLGMGTGESLLRTAADLPLDRRPEAVWLYSCVGRERVLDERSPEEVATIVERFPGVALSGFFTFGEVGPSAGGRTAFYNHTAILVLLAEEPA